MPDHRKFPGCIYCRGLAGTPRQNRGPGSVIGGRKVMFSRDLIPLARQGCYQLLRTTINALRLHAPAAHPVIVRSGWNLPEHIDAYCTRRDNRFVIMLGQHLSPSKAPEVVVHEWAHARAWHHRHDHAVQAAQTGEIDEAEFDASCHDAAWGVEYAHCWRVFTRVVLSDA